MATISLKLTERLSARIEKEKRASDHEVVLVRRPSPQPGQPRVGAGTVVPSFLAASWRPGR